MNLYIVFDRKQTLSVLVAADAGSQGALGQIAEDNPSLEWNSANTFTRKIMGNIEAEPGVIMYFPLKKNAVIPLKKDRSWKSAKMRRRRERPSE